MNDKIDINSCYRKVFELIGRGCSITELLRSVADYTGIAMVVMSITGEVLAASSEQSVEAKSLIDEFSNERAFLELLFGCMDQRGSASDIGMLRFELEGKSCAATIISSHGNDQGICILAASKDRCEDEVMEQINDLVNKSLSLIMDYSEKNGMGNYSTLRKIAAKILFEKGYDKGIRMQKIQELYETDLKGSCIAAILCKESKRKTNLQRIGDELFEKYDKLFYYTKDQCLYVLFSNVLKEEQIYKYLQEICGKYSLWCGVSDPFADMVLICKKRFMITKAMEIGRKQDPMLALYHEYDYYMQIVVGCAVEQIGKARCFEKELCGLKEEDVLKGTEFYHTLREYLLMRNNVSATAKRLFIHRNTMIYRLRRIAEYLKVDINDPMISQRLLITIMLQEMEM